MPFRYGAGLVVGMLATVGLLIGGLVTWSGGTPDGHGASNGHGPRGRARASRPVRAAVPPTPSRGAYPPSRETVRMPAGTRVLSVPPSTPPAHAAPRSSPSVTCPPVLKRWTWLWEVCKHQQNG